MVDVVTLLHSEGFALPQRKQEIINIDIMIRNWAAVFVNCRTDRLRGGGALDFSYLGLGFWRIYIAQTSYEACSWLIQMYRWFLVSFPSQSLCGVVVYCLSPPWHFLCAGASVTSNSITNVYGKKVSRSSLIYNTSSFDDESEFSSILWEKSSWAALCALGIASGGAIFCTR